MGNKKVLYEDVVIGDSPVSENSVEEKQSAGAKKTKTSGNSSEKSSKKSGKDEKAHGAIEQRADRLAEDPFMTPSEKMSMDGGSKEKEKKADADNSEGSEKQNDEQKEAEDRQKEVDILVSRSDKILLQAKGLFPFDFFPDTLTIDANKVNIIIKTFFATETATSVLLKEIMDVRVESTLFFGKLIIDYGPHPLKISTVYVPALKKTDALKAKEIIEGLLVLYRAENIDTTKMKPEETMEEVKEIGKIEERE